MEIDLEQVGAAGGVWGCGLEGGCAMGGLAVAAVVVVVVVVVRWAWARCCCCGLVWRQRGGGRERQQSGAAAVVCCCLKPCAVPAHLPRPCRRHRCPQARAELRELSGQDEGRRLDDILGSVGLAGVAEQLKDLRLGGCGLASVVVVVAGWCGIPPMGGWAGLSLGCCCLGAVALQRRGGGQHALPSTCADHHTHTHTHQPHHTTPHHTTPHHTTPHHTTPHHATHTPPPHTHTHTLLQASCWTRRRRVWMRPLPSPRSSSSSRWSPQHADVCGGGGVCCLMCVVVE